MFLEFYHIYQTTNQYMSILLAMFHTQKRYEQMSVFIYMFYIHTDYFVNAIHACVKVASFTCGMMCSKPILTSFSDFLYVRFDFGRSGFPLLKAMILNLFSLSASISRPISSRTPF